MASILFREEAARLGIATEFGDAAFHQPLSLKALVLSLVATFIGFLLFAALARSRPRCP